MIRGTNAEIRFGVPYHGDLLSDVYVILSQDGNSGPSKSRRLPITKKKSCHCLQKDPCIIRVELTGEETARFKDDRKANAQLFAVVTEGEKKIKYATVPQLIPVYPMIGDKIFGDADIKPSDESDWVILDGGGQL